MSDIALLLELAMALSPTARVVREAGGEAGLTEVRSLARKHLATFPDDQLSPDIVSEAVRLSIHSWVDKHQDDLSAEACGFYLDQFMSEAIQRSGKSKEELTREACQRFDELRATHQDEDDGDIPPGVQELFRLAAKNRGSSPDA